MTSLAGGATRARPGRGRQPGRARRKSLRRPPGHGCGEGLLDRLLGDVDVAEDADQRGHRAAVLGAEHPGDLQVTGSGQAGYRPSPRSVNGRTSVGSPVTCVNLRAHSSAASRSGALTTVNPPRCSLPSVNGPSVISTSSPRSRTTVAVLGGCSAPAKTHA